MQPEVAASSAQERLMLHVLRLLDAVPIGLTQQAWSDLYYTADC